MSSNEESLKSSPESSASQSRTLSKEHPGPLGQLPTFPPQQSLKALLALVQAHGKENGFAVQIRNRKPTKHGELAYLYCTKGGTYNNRSKDTRDIHQSARRLQALLRLVASSGIDVPVKVLLGLEGFYKSTITIV
jgi:hypothetical protein